MSDVTVTNEPPIQPLGNDPASRNPDGSIKDQSLANTTPSETPEKKPETPPTDDKKPPAEGDKKPDVPAAGAPEKYEDFKTPEGFKFDEKVIPEIQATFKDLGLTQDQGQKLVDFYAKNFSEAAKAPYDAWANTQREWGEEIASRFGDKADSIRGDINSAINTVLPPSLAKSFRTALDLTGAGTNPDLVEGLSILLKPHFEGRPVLGGKPSPEGQKAPSAGPVSIADAMYGHLRK